MAKKKQQSLQPAPLVAIDLGSDSVRAMAAEYTDNGMLRILGVEASGKFPCVERGIVNNSSNAGFTISETLKLLANRIKAETLPSAFVCAGGRTMQIVDVFSKRDQVRKREVSQELLDEMEAECKQKIEANNPTVAVLDLIPTYFVLDGKEQDDIPAPEQRAALVETHFTAFVGLRELEQKVLDSFDRSTKHLEHIYVRPDALLCALAADEDLPRGCAILDMGAQTTTLTICKGNQYLCNKVVPQGGYDISRNIEAQGMTLPYAEKLKCSYGFASPDMVEDNHRMRIPSSVRGQEIVMDTREVAAIIAAGLDRILDPLMQLLREYEDRIGVLYITGGASMLQGVEQYIQAKTTIPVMYGSHAMFLTPDTPDAMCAPVYSSLVGTLLLGANYRANHPEAPVHAPKKGLLDKIKDGTLDIFSGQNDNY